METKLTLQRRGTGLSQLFLISLNNVSDLVCSSTLSDFQFEMRVRWIDTDAAGIAHFSNFFRFVEEAEEALLANLGFNYSSIASKYSMRLPRVEAHCKYSSPCRHSDRIRINISIREVTERTFREEFRIFNVTTGKATAEGYFVCIGTNLDVEKSLPLPVELVSKLKDFS